MKKILSLLFAFLLLVAQPASCSLLLSGGGSTASPIAAPTEASQFTAANSEYLSVANDANLQFGNEDFSVAGWVYLDSTGVAFRVPIGKWDYVGNKREYAVYFNDALAKFGFFVSNNGTANSGVFTSSTISTGAWHYVVGVHDSVNNLLKISLDGAAFDTAAYVLGGNANTSSFTLGADGSTDEFWDGRISKAGVWRKVLSAGEVTQLYNSGNGLAHCQLDSGLLTSLEGYWNLSESSGTRADSTANANNLTDNNTVTGNPGVGSGNCL